MNIYENLATQAITSFFYNEPFWKKKILFDFLLSPFDDLEFSDIDEVKTQDNLKETIPDFTIITENKKIRYEVKINNTDLTPSEQKKGSRDAYLIRKNYYHYYKIPQKLKKEKKILYWEDLFEKIDKLGATKDFSRLDLIREYMCEGIHTLLLTPHEVAMFYSPETVKAVYTMSDKILLLCKSFLESHSEDYEYGKSRKKDFENPQKDDLGIGYYFKERKGQKREFFIGLDLSVTEKSWAIGLNIAENKYENYELDKEILTKSNNEEDLQEKFNKNVEEVLKQIK